MTIDMLWQWLDNNAGLIYQVATVIFGSTFVLTVLISTKDHNRLWHAYSALLLLLTVTTLGFALLCSEQVIIQEPMLSGLIRLMFIAMACVAMSINIYIAWWLAQGGRTHAETYR